MEGSKEIEQAGVRRRLLRQPTTLIMGGLVRDFAQNTTLHGLGYIGEKKLTIIEKIFWTLSFITSVSLCALLIWSVWVKWQSAPIIVTRSDDLVSIEEIPFPSVTICPHSKLKRFVCNARVYSKINDLELRKRIEAGCLARGIPNSSSREKFDLEIVKKMYEITPDILHLCYFYGELSNCRELFKPVLTVEGVCFTMNSLAANEILRNDSVHSDYSYVRTSQPSVGWSHSGGYSHLNSSSDVYPRPGKLSIDCCIFVFLVFKFFGHGTRKDCMERLVVQKVVRAQDLVAALQHDSLRIE